jgi:hypothetical protein
MILSMRCHTCCRQLMSIHACGCGFESLLAFTFTWSCLPGSFSGFQFIVKPTWHPQVLEPRTTLFPTIHEQFVAAGIQKYWNHALPQCQQRLKPCTTAGTHKKCNHALPRPPAPTSVDTMHYHRYPQVLKPFTIAVFHTCWSHSLLPVPTSTGTMHYHQCPQVLTPCPTTRTHKDWNHVLRLPVVRSSHKCRSHAPPPVPTSTGAIHYCRYPQGLTPCNASGTSGY